MPNLPTPRRTAALRALWGAVIVAACVIIAVTWSDVVAGLGLAVAVLAWVAPRSPNM
jgi:hypothetical protein